MSASPVEPSVLVRLDSFSLYFSKEICRCGSPPPPSPPLPWVSFCLLKWGHALPRLTNLQLAKGAQADFKLLILLPPFLCSGMTGGCAVTMPGFFAGNLTLQMWDLFVLQILDSLENSKSSS